MMNRREFSRTAFAVGAASSLNAKTGLIPAECTSRMRLCAARFNSSQRNPCFCEGLVSPY